MNKGIVRLQAENLKRLKAVEIVPGDNAAVVVGGMNGNGKTSVLDAIALAIGGLSGGPSRPIRNGEDSALVVVELEDLIVKRRWTASGSELIVTNKEGAKFSSPQKMLDKLIGKLSFDPLEFSRMKPTDQSKTLRDLVGLDTSDIDERREDLYVTRTDVNRQVKMFEGQLAGLTYHDDAPEKEVSVDDYMAKLDRIREHNQGIANAKVRQQKIETVLEMVERDIDSTKRLIADLERQLDAARESLAAHETKYDNVRVDLVKQIAAIDVMQDIDEKPIQEAIRECGATNQKVIENRNYKAVEAQLHKLQSRSDAMTAEIEAIDQDKAERLANAKYPVDGLSFDSDGTVLYKGIPFDQCSAAETLDVSVAMAMALNPKLPVILIRDGSLMDDVTLERVTRRARDVGFQVWIERVSEGEECTVVIEDGAVRGAITNESEAKPKKAKAVAQ
jgi:hypothetical protein